VDGAVAALGEVAGLSPGRRDAAFALARLHENAGRWPEALALLDALAAADAPARAEVASRKGQLHARRGDGERAAASFRAALELDATCAGALEGLGLLDREAGTWEAALNRFLEAAEHHRNAADVIRCFLLAAEVYRWPLGDAAHARDCLERVLEL